jgi:WD40 repeat protein
LQEGDIEWVKFCKRLKNDKNNQFARLLWGTMSADSRKKVDRILANKDSNNIDKSFVADNINRIMSRKYFYRDQSLPYNETELFYNKYEKYFICQFPIPNRSSYPFHVPDVITLNRLFLEWAFPDSIKKSSIPRKIVSGYPIYYQEKGKGIRIPHKVWSPDGKSILFTGALEKAYCANVYAVDVKTKKITKILDVNDSSGSFNPDLEWTKNGMVITSESGIFLRDVKITGGSPGVIHKLQLPDSISGMRYGKISPDGKKLFFIGKKDNQVYVFIYNFEDRSLMEEKAGTGNDVSQYCGAWINPDKDTIIKNELEYQEFRGYEDLR